MLTKGMLLSSASLLGCIACSADAVAQQATLSGRGITTTLQIRGTRQTATAMKPVPLHGTNHEHKTAPAKRTNQSSASSNQGLNWRISSQVTRKTTFQANDVASAPSEANPSNGIYDDRALTQKPKYDPFDHVERKRLEEKESRSDLGMGASRNTLQIASQTPRLKSVDTQEIQQATWLGSPTRPERLTLPRDLGDTTSPTEQKRSAGNAAPVNDFRLTAPIQSTAESVQSESESGTQRSIVSANELTPPNISGGSITNPASRQIEFEPSRRSTTTIAPIRTAQLPELPAPSIPVTKAKAQRPLALPNAGGQGKAETQNPFPTNQNDATEKQPDTLRSRLSDESNAPTNRLEYGSGTDYLSNASFTCEEFRDRIASQTIDQISLDISPPFRPDEFDQRRHEELLSDFIEQQPLRTWSTIDGQVIGSGRLIDLAYEKAVIELEDGKRLLLPMSQLSEGDLAHINTDWGLPRECRIEQVAYLPREWAPAKVTWKASNLSHHPLYFESVNLERYGHTRGPLIEPVVQTAHFFGNIAILPYKMGVHGPRESQYALGYYRPGNEAPWIKQPLPISARGALAQAATMTGLFWLIP